MATAPTNYGKITKYYRFINFQLIVTESDWGESCPPYSNATAFCLTQEGQFGWEQTHSIAFAQWAL